MAAATRPKRWGSSQTGVMKSAVATRARSPKRKTPASSPAAAPTRILSSRPNSRTSGEIIVERSPGPILAAQPPVVAQAVRRNLRRNSAMAGIVAGLKPPYGFCVRKQGRRPRRSPMRSPKPLLALVALAASLRRRRRCSRRKTVPRLYASRLTPCKIPGEKGEVDAFCGLHEVWENRAAKAGRKLHPKVRSSPRWPRRRGRTPCSSSAAGRGRRSPRTPASPRATRCARDRDLVFVDQRGTGEPDKPDCCQLGGHDDDSRAAPGGDVPGGRRPRVRGAAGAKSHDLTSTPPTSPPTTSTRCAPSLGYGKVNVLGGSYGTRAAQGPPAAASGVGAHGRPGRRGADGRAALALPRRGRPASPDLLLGWCEKNAACHGKFPRCARSFRP